MNIRTGLTIASCAAAALLATSAMAAPGDMNPGANPQVSVLSGGIGDSGMSAIEQHQDHYNLKLVFAEKNGDYVADVNVQVRDKDGNLVANTNSPGPVLLMNLPKGSYTVSSTEDGKNATQKVFIRSERPLKTYIMRFASSDDTVSANMQ